LLKSGIQDLINAYNPGKTAPNRFVVFQEPDFSMTPTAQNASIDAGPSQDYITGLKTK